MVLLIIGGSKMKRRKTLNKYRVNDRGQITNTQPVLSPKTRQLLEFASVMSALSGYDDPEGESIMEVEEDGGSEEEGGTSDSSICD